MSGRRLVVRSALEAGESLQGYVARLAFLNGYANPAKLMKQKSGPRFATRLHYGRDLKLICRWADVEPATFEAVRYRRASAKEGVRKFAGNAIERRVIDPQRPRVCPAFLREPRPILAA